MDNTSGMKICLLRRVLVTFYKLQKPLDYLFPSYNNKCDQDLHLSILATLKNLHAKWAPDKDMKWLHSCFSV